MRTLTRILVALVFGSIALAAGGHDASAQDPNRATVKAQGLRQGDLVTVLRALRNRALGKASLAQATTTTQIQITNQTDFMIDGLIYRKAAANNISIAALTATAANQNSRVRVEINSAGTVSFVQGPIVSTTAPAGVLTAGLRSAAKSTLGYFDMPASFTPGTSLTSLLTFYDGDPDLDAVGLDS